MSFWYYYFILIIEGVEKKSFTMCIIINIHNTWRLHWTFVLLTICVKFVFIMLHIFLMQLETEYSFFNEYSKQDTRASNWTFHFVLFFFSLKCASIRIDHRKKGLVGKTQRLSLWLQDRRSLDLSLIVPPSRFWTLSEMGVGVWALCAIVPLVWVDTQPWRCQRNESLTVNAWLLWWRGNDKNRPMERDLLF